MRGIAMRIVVLGSSRYSETGCAIAARVAELGYAPVGALVLRTLDSGTLLRKVGQWGVSGAARYARTKLAPRRGADVSNPCLRPALTHGGVVFRSLRQVAARYDFPIAACRDLNAPSSIARLRQWSPDLMIFTGGNILRKPLLEVPRLGVLNVHLGLLPEIRGMSSPEWSLLKNVPPGITVHYLDAGIDTGPILQRWELPDVNRSESLTDLRNRLIAFGVSKLEDVITALDRGTMSAMPQGASPSAPGSSKDNQFFVMHEWLQTRAADRLTRARPTAVTATVNG
jgi:hypothetical protein